MMTVAIRKQGGASIMTIPADLMKLLHLKIGSELKLQVKDQYLLVRPIACKERKRYSLSELLQGVTRENARSIRNKTKWARTGHSVGRELI